MMRTRKIMSFKNAKSMTQNTSEDADANYGFHN